AAVLTVEAYRTSRQTLETDARRTVRVAAEKVNETLERHLQLQQEQAEGFLASAASLCGENSPSGAIAWEVGCTRTALEAFRATEQAAGAVIEEGGRTIAQAGVRPLQSADPPGSEPRLLAREAGGFDYTFSIARRQSTLTLQFTAEDLFPFFQDRS